MVSPEHDMVMSFNAMVPDDEYDPEFDLFNDYIFGSIKEGPDYTDPLLSLLSMNGIVVVILVTSVIVASILCSF